MASTTCPRCNGTGQIESDVDVGRFFRSLRENKRLTLREQARRMGFSPAYVSDLELGRRIWNTKIREAYKKALK
ncbi:MAG: helix-turn-helix domain-containing protein [Acidobacteria bacterium]|nr:helix-turn-helix domain-containing protein [Acidobacteriota bacterium]